MGPPSVVRSGRRSAAAITPNHPPTGDWGALMAPSGVSTSYLPQSRTQFRSAGKTQTMGDIERVVPTDADVVRASLTDPGAFAGLFDRHAGSVYRYVAKRVAREDAEDLVGDTFATAFCSRKRFDLTRPNARPWLFGIATNLVHHHWRSEERRIRRERAAHPIEPIGDPADEALSRLFFQGQAAPITRALARLDGASLDVLLLVAGPGLTYDEVALALDVPVGTVRSRLALGAAPRTRRPR